MTFIQLYHNINRTLKNQVTAPQNRHFITDLKQSTTLLFYYFVHYTIGFITESAILYK